MATPSKKSKALATFTHPMQIEVREVKFEPQAAVAMMDLARLSKGNHKIEIGFAEGGCCQRAVSAVIKNGMVTDIDIADCKDSKKPVDKEMLAVIEAARRKIARSSQADWQPIPVAEFFRSAANMQRIVISLRKWCIQVCFSWGGVIRCYFCCLIPPHCGRVIIADGPLS